MTVVCAMAVGEELFVAADSALEGLPLTISTKKLAIWNDPPIVMAGSGDETTVALIIEYLAIQLAKNPTISWEEFTELGMLELGRLNGIHMDAVMRSHLAFPSDGGHSAVLIAGFLGGRPEIAQLERTGSRGLHLRAGRDFAAIGAGDTHAAMTHAVLAEKGLLPSDGAAAIRQITEFAARYAPHCSMPVEVTRITAASADLLRHR